MGRMMMAFALAIPLPGLSPPVHAHPTLESVLSGALPADPASAPQSIDLAPATAAAIADAAARTAREGREFALCFGPADRGGLTVRAMLTGGPTSVAECPPPALLALHTHPQGSAAVFSDNDLRANNTLATRRSTMAAAVAATDGSLLIAIETRRSLARRAAWIARAGLKRNGEAIAIAISSAARAEAVARLAYVQPVPTGQRLASWTDGWLAAATPLLELGVADYCGKLGLACYVRHAAQQPLRKLEFAPAEAAARRRPDLQIDRAIAAAAILVTGLPGREDPDRLGIAPALGRRARSLRELFDLAFLPLEGLTKPNDPGPSFRYQADGRFSFQKFRGRIGVARSGDPANDIRSEETALGAFAADPACVRFGRRVTVKPMGKEGEADVQALTGGSFDLVCVRPGATPLWLKQQFRQGVWITDAVTPVHGFPKAGLMFDAAHACVSYDSVEACQIKTFKALPDLPRWNGGAWEMGGKGR